MRLKDIEPNKLNDILYILNRRLRKEGRNEVAMSYSHKIYTQMIGVLQHIVYVYMRGSEGKCYVEKFRGIMFEICRS